MTKLKNVWNIISKDLTCVRTHPKELRIHKFLFCSFFEDTESSSLLYFVLYHTYTSTLWLPKTLCWMDRHTFAFLELLLELINIFLNSNWTLKWRTFHGDGTKPDFRSPESGIVALAFQMNVFRMRNENRYSLSNCTWIQSALKF